MTWSPDTLAKIKRLQAEHPWPELGQLVLDALNKATLAEKAKMTPEAIAAEEEARRNYKYRSHHDDPSG
jgi:hypothetical protein